MVAEVKNTVLSYFAILVIGLLSVFLVLFIYSREVNSAQIDWRANLASALQEAKVTNKPVLIYFFSSNCFYCQKLKYETLENSSIMLMINQYFVPVKIELKNSLSELSKYNITAIPSVIALRPNETLIGVSTGFQLPDEFIKNLWVMQAAYAGMGVTSLSKLTENVSQLANQVCTKDECINAPQFSMSTSQKNYISPINLSGDLEDVESRFFNANFLNSSKIWVIIPLFLILGFVVSLTPCTLMFLLLVASYLMNSIRHHTMSARLTMPLIFTMSLAFSYAVFGSLSAYLGVYIPSFVGNIWVVSIFCALFALVAFYTLGLYQLKTPAFIAHKLVRLNKFKNHYTHVEVAIMGMIMTLIAAPCIAAPLIGILIYVQQSKNILVGSLSLFSFGIGICIPLLLASIFGAKFLPNAGVWSHELKAFFGLTLLGVAVWLVGSIVPLSAYYMAIGTYVFVVGYYMTDKFWLNFPLPIRGFFSVAMLGGIYIIVQGIHIV